MRYQRKFPLSTRVTRSELYSDIYIYLYIHNFVDLYRQGLSKRKSPRLIQLISVPLLALLLRGNRSEDIPPISPTCFVISRNQDSIEPAGSCPETAGDWPSAEHRAWALPKFSAPSYQLPGEARACWTSGSSRLRGAETGVRIRRTLPLEYESTSKIHALVNIHRESPR